MATNTATLLAAADKALTDLAIASVGARDTAAIAHLSRDLAVMHDEAQTRLTAATDQYLAVVDALKALS